MSSCPRPAGHRRARAGSHCWRPVDCPKAGHHALPYALCIQFSTPAAGRTSFFKFSPMSVCTISLSSLRGRCCSGRAGLQAACFAQTVCDQQTRARKRKAYLVYPKHSACEGELYARSGHHRFMGDVAACYMQRPPFSAKESAFARRKVRLRALTEFGDRTFLFPLSKHCL